MRGAIRASVTVGERAKDTPSFFTQKNSTGCGFPRQGHRQRWDLGDAASQLPGKEGNTQRVYRKPAFLDQSRDPSPGPRSWISPRRSTLSRITLPQGARLLWGREALSVWAMHIALLIPSSPSASQLTMREAESAVLLPRQHLEGKVGDQENPFAEHQIWPARRESIIWIT